MIDSLLVAQTGRSHMTDQLTLDDFSELAEQEITLRFGDREQPARIIDTRETPGGLPGGRTPFSVVLRSGPPDHYWPQGTHTLLHPRRGELALFIVPIGPDEEGMRYEISFS